MEQLYYRMRNNGWLFKLWPFLTGIYAEDQEQWIEIYKSHNA